MTTWADVDVSLLRRLADAGDERARRYLEAIATGWAVADVLDDPDWPPEPAGPMLQRRAR